MISARSVGKTLTWTTVGITKMTLRTCVTIGCLKLDATFAATCLLLTVSGAVEMIAVALATHVRFIPVSTVRPVVAWFALITIYSLGIVLAVFANTAALEHPVNIQRLASQVHFFVVVALV
jgi:hypothetical protein